MAHATSSAWRCCLHVVHTKQPRARSPAPRRSPRSTRRPDRPAFVTPVISPIKRLRDTPTSIGPSERRHPSQLRAARRSTSRPAWRTRSPDRPRCSPRATPALSGTVRPPRAARSRSRPPDRRRTSRARTSPCRQRRRASASAQPRLAPRRTRAPSAGSSRKPETSLTIDAPAASASLRHARLHRVDRDRDARDGRPRRPATTGITRRSSSSASTGVAPCGRVDSPPMSMHVGALATSRSMWRRASSTDRSAPPSLKLSGVTLTMPTIRGLEQRERRRREVPFHRQKPTKRMRAMPEKETGASSAPVSHIHVSLAIRPGSAPDRRAAAD